MLNVTTSTKVSLRAKSTMISEAATGHLHSSLAKPYLSSMTPETCGSLPPSSTNAIHGSYLIQVIDAGQYRHAHDHI